MKMRKQKRENIIVLYLEGNINIDSAGIIEETSQLMANGISKFLCNFANVDMVDYNGLSIITIAYKNIINKNGVMKFCNTPPHLRELFRTVRLDLVFDMHETEDEAIKSFEKSTQIDKLYLRRRFKRLDLQIPVKYRLGTSQKSRLLSGKILNISGEGIFVYTKDVFPVSTELNMDIFLEKNIKPLKAKGMIIWIADRELQPHCYPGMGVSFANLDSKSQKSIIDYIDKNITHRSKA